MEPVIIDRLIELGPQDRITAYCGDWRCPRHCGDRNLDIPALIAKHGELELAALTRRLRCTACGHRPGEIRYGWRLLQRGTG